MSLNIGHRINNFFESRDFLYLVIFNLSSIIAIYLLVLYILCYKYTAVVLRF